MASLPKLSGQMKRKAVWQPSPLCLCSDLTLPLKNACSGWTGCSLPAASRCWQAGGEQGHWCCPAHLPVQVSACITSRAHTTAGGTVALLSKKEGCIKITSIKMLRGLSSSFSSVLFHISRLSNDNSATNCQCFCLARTSNKTK